MDHKPNPNMRHKHTPEEWLPYVVGLTCMLASTAAAYLFSQYQDHFVDFLSATSTCIPWLILLIGVGFSILLACIVRAAIVIRRRTVTLNEMSQNLKNEITERMSAEESRQKLEVALLQGQKLQAMGTLAGGIAHDFNNILYAMIGYIEMSREDVSADSLPYKNLGKALEGAHRGQELIARILAFSRRQHQQVGIIHLKTTIEAVLALLRPTIPASVMIEFEPTFDTTISGNQTQIHQVLVNLINNAVDAMDGEGTITIHLSHIKAGDPILKEFPSSETQDYCKIEVIDDGHGMDQHTMERIFEPFFTTKEVGKGTGLGLSIVHTLVHEHQGEITVDSQLGRGTTFTIILPEHKSS